MFRLPGAARGVQAKACRTAKAAFGAAMPVNQKRMRNMDEAGLNELVNIEVERRLNDPSVLRGIILAIQEENESRKSLITNQQKVINEQRKTIDSSNETVKALIP
jgi:hypothetical protein